MDDFPAMSVRIGEIAGIAAPTGLLRGLEQRGPSRVRAPKGGIDFGP
jgi:hypothetical protein